MTMTTTTMMMMTLLLLNDDIDGDDDDNDDDDDDDGAAAADDDDCGNWWWCLMMLGDIGGTWKTIYLFKNRDNLVFRRRQIYEQDKHAWHTFTSVKLDFLEMWYSSCIKHAKNLNEDVCCLYVIDGKFVPPLSFIVSCPPPVTLPQSFLLNHEIIW